MSTLRRNLSALNFALNMKINLPLLRRIQNRFFCHFADIKRVVLGIETSCDDTGAAVVDEEGNILGEGYNSQMKTHLENGGVIPHIAAHFHQENIESVISTAIEKSRVSFDNISAIAVTTKPGLKGSLLVGIQHAKTLAKKYSKPIIPIHHMEAHALTPRLLNKISFPFLALLASGGHCQLALVKEVDEFLLLGNSCHNSPGEMLDKIARRLKLQNLPACYEMSGGQAIEHMSQGGDPTAYNFPLSMVQYRDCDFSFSGFGAFATSIIESEENQYEVAADGVIPNVKNFCASLLRGYAVHLVHRLNRAFVYCEQENLMNEAQRTLVFSGGVACNTYLKEALKQACIEMKSQFFVPPPALCNDNGVMIAWNGIEKLKANCGILFTSEDVHPDSDCPLGVDIREAVRKANIKVKTPKISVNVQEEKAFCNN